MDNTRGLTSDVGRLNAFQERMSVCVFTVIWAACGREPCSSCRCRWADPRPPPSQTEPPPAWRWTDDRLHGPPSQNRARNVATRETSSTESRSPTYPPAHTQTLLTWHSLNERETAKATTVAGLQPLMGVWYHTLQYFITTNSWASAGCSHSQTLTESQSRAAEHRITPQTQGSYSVPLSVLVQQDDHQFGVHLIAILTEGEIPALERHVHQIPEKHTAAGHPQTRVLLKHCCKIMPSK